MMLFSRKPMFELRIGRKDESLEGAELIDIGFDGDCPREIGIVRLYWLMRKRGKGRSSNTPK